jgi:glucosamine-6-phosphate deaminase
MYRELARMSREGLLNFSKVITFNLDEYVGLEPSHPQSFHHYMQVHLFGHLAIPPEQIHIPDGTAADLEEECQRYEEEIARHGGIDPPWSLGSGSNGHIGFNEPGSDWGTMTRLVALSERRAGGRRGDSGAWIWFLLRAITMGIKTIMRARRLLLLASGEEKAGIVREVLQGPIVKEVPASILQLHPDATMILDAAAASKLNLCRVGGASAGRPRTPG